MTDKETEQVYPVKTIHQFIEEINREKGKFKIGALVSITISSLLLIGFVGIFIRTVVRAMEVSDIILELLLAAFLIYSIYLMVHQYRFFRRWESRMARLNSLEQKLMPDAAEEALSDSGKS